MTSQLRGRSAAAAARFQAWRRVPCRSSGPVFANCPWPDRGCAEAACAGPPQNVACRQIIHPLANPRDPCCARSVSSPSRPSWPLSPAAQAAETPHRPESQQEYWAQIDRKDWSAAVAAAQQLVAAARAHASTAMALAEALTLLGNAQFGAQELRRGADVIQRGPEHHRSARRRCQPEAAGSVTRPRLYVRCRRAAQRGRPTAGAGAAHRSPQLRPV